MRLDRGTKTKNKKTKNKRKPFQRVRREYIVRMKNTKNAFHCREGGIHGLAHKEQEFKGEAHIGGAKQRREEMSLCNVLCSACRTTTAAPNDRSIVSISGRDVKR